MRTLSAILADLPLERLNAIQGRAGSLMAVEAARLRPHTPEPENAEDRAVQAKTLSDKHGIPEDDEA